MVGTAVIPGELSAEKQPEQNQESVDSNSSSPSRDEKKDVLPGNAANFADGMSTLLSPFHTASPSTPTDVKNTAN